jgi:ubiquinone/menaquinone biosynthesis C-methylase UbiE
MPREASRVLEVGCSWGYLLASLKHQARERYGLDINLPDIKDATRLYRNVARYLCGVAEALPFPDGFFDAVIMSEVLEHTTSEAQVLREVSRVVRGGGTVILTVPHRGPMELTDVTNLKCRFPDLHRRVYGWKHRGDFSRFVPVTQYHRHYTVRKLRKLVAPYFAIAAVRRGGFLLFALADYAAFARQPQTLRLMFKLAGFDYSLDYGPLSYNLAFCLRKQES